MSGEIIRYQGNALSPKNLRTLNACLLALGAEFDEVYKPRSNGYRIRKPSLYSMTKEEIREWAHSLWRRQIVLNHPDRGGDLEVSTSLNLAYRRICHILEWRGRLK